MAAQDAHPNVLSHKSSSAWFVVTNTQPNVTITIIFVISETF